MKLGERWDKDPRLRQWLHRLDLIIIVLILAAVVWFVRSHWKNRIAAAAQS
jgi:chromate transport protein ChrA